MVEIESMNWQLSNTDFTCLAEATMISLNSLSLSAGFNRTVTFMVGINPTTLPILYL